MQQFELDYAGMVAQILKHGELRETRNAVTKSLFGMSLTVDVNDNLALIQGRQIFYKGVLGELAAMLRKPQHVDDFKKWGCNYWDKWADKDGNLSIDYGNAWFDFNGFDQIADLKDKLANNPTDRRMIVSGWRPDGLSSLSLPCCHYSYQFYVERGGVLNMIWTQRSVDMMIGLPSDIVFASAWLISIANEFNMNAGYIKMDFGDCHVYESHFEEAKKYLIAVEDNCFDAPEVFYWPTQGRDFCLMEPDDFEVIRYNHGPKLTLELIA